MKDTVFAVVFRILNLQFRGNMNGGDNGGCDFFNRQGHKAFAKSTK